MKVDVDEAQDIAHQCQIRSMPTFHFYKNGQLVHQFSGANVIKLKTTLSDLMAVEKEDVKSADGACCKGGKDKACCEEENLRFEKKDDVILAVPEVVMMTFFKECTSALNRYHIDSDDYVDTSSTSENILIPLTLDQHKSKILSLQMKVVEKIVSTYTSRSTDKVKISVETLSSALRQVATLGDDYLTLKTAAEEFNSSARLALARIVLISERNWRQNGSPNTRDFIDKDNYSKSMMRDAFKDFFGLTTAAVELPEIKKELKNIEETKSSDDVPSLIPPMTDDLLKLSLPSAQKKLICLQRACLNAVNFDHRFATAVLNKLPENYPNDGELIHLFRNFVDAMTSAVTNATCSSLNDEATGTKVVEVKYKTVDDIGVPSTEKMSHQRNFEQMKELAMARKAAELQQTVMAELLDLDEIRRDIILKEAKAVHDNFITETMKLPIGPERVHYLQSIDDSTQRKLVMYKMWEQLVARNGGKSPKIDFSPV